MPGRGANAAVEPDARKVLGDVLCRGATLLLVGWIGRNRRYSQQCEQPIETLLEILIDPVEDGVEGAHDWLRHRVAFARGPVFIMRAPQRGECCSKATGRPDHGCAARETLVFRRDGVQDHFEPVVVRGSGEMDELINRSIALRASTE